MNFLTSLFRNNRSEPSHAAQVSDRAREVKTELERLSSSMYLDDEQYDTVERQYLSGLNPAECAAELYPGLLLFEPRHLPDREPTAAKYNRLLSKQYYRIYHGNKGWELDTLTSLNIVRAARQLAPVAFLGANCGGWFLDPVIEKAGASGNPELIRAIAELVEAVAVSEAPNAYLMHQDIDKWLGFAGLSRKDIPALRKAADGVTARMEERRQIVEAAPEPLGPVLEKVFENEISFYLLKKGDYPAIDAVIDGSPEERGRALQFLIDLVMDGEKCRDFTHLGRNRGRWANECSDLDQPCVFFNVLAIFLARFVHTLDDRDATHAKLVALLSYGHNRGDYFKPKKQVQRELLKTVAEFPEGLTATAMAKLVTLPSFANWRQPLEEVLGKVAPAKDQAEAKPVDLPIELPDWIIGTYEADERLFGHYSSLFDARLYTDPHDEYLNRVVQVAQAAFAAQEAGVSLRALKDVCSMEMQKHGLISVLGQDEKTRELHAWKHAVERGWELDPNDSLVWLETVAFFNVACDHYKMREAVRSMVETYPEVARELSLLVSKLSKGGAPSAKWLRDARTIFDRLDANEWIARLTALLDHDAPFQTHRGSSNEPYIRTMIYLASFLPPEKVGGLLTDYAIKKCYVTDPGIGIRSEKLGNACVWTLSQMLEGAGVPYLARILARTKYPKIRKMIDTRLNAAAEQAGIARADLDEATVPTHDLDADGKRAIAFEQGKAILVVEGNSARIEWVNAQGKPVKSATAAMKQDKDLMKEVRADLKELKSDLSIQPQRLQKLYLQDRSWSATDWRERYLDHPLMRGFTRRLVWQVERYGEEPVAVLADEEGKAVRSVTGEPVSLDNARLRLWHPTHGSVEQIEAWRDRLEELRVTQPFAQVWREIYALTDAERATSTYSNRWAAHILKQQQAMTLARINGWTVTARMWVDAPNDAPWHLHLPAHRLVAQYWVEGAGGDDPEVTDNCAYSFVNTDRVTFFATGEGASDGVYGPGIGDPVPLRSIPPIIFSEVMRNCDLFTAVASIAADPAWLDRGQDAAHPSQWSNDARRYWQDVNSGDLVESGKRRRAMLERIVPRLAIADKLKLTDRTLVVEGTRHTYEIHLGSGACSYGGRHICIVPKSSSAGHKVWLPFEGDRTLSIIISKAILLAADDRITDPVILQQL